MKYLIVSGMSADSLSRIDIVETERKLYWQYHGQFTINLMEPNYIVGFLRSKGWRLVDYSPDFEGIEENYLDEYRRENE